MKIRSCFVSNSSSSSFCILGIRLPENFDEDSFYKNNKIDKKFLEFEYGIYNYYDQYFIGVNPEQMKNDETLIQFKERICQEIKKLGIDIKPDELNWFIDGGYVG